MSVITALGTRLVQLEDEGELDSAGLVTEEAKTAAARRRAAWRRARGVESHSQSIHRAIVDMAGPATSHGR